MCNEYYDLLYFDLEITFALSLKVNKNLQFKKQERLLFKKANA